MRFKKGLSKISPYKPGKPIEEVKRALGLAEVYKLASNEIPFAPRYIRKAVLRELENINRYPESSCFYLRKVIAQKLGISGEQIVFGNGSDEIITLVVRAFIVRGDEVIVAYPTFLIYELQAKVEGARVVRVPLRDFRYDLEAMAEKITGKTKIIFIANPDNPTGTYVNQREIAEFLKRVPKNILVYLDEAYFEFAPEDFPKSLDILKKKSNIIVTRTFSKVYGLAGLRIGYGITTKDIANVLNRIREPFNINRFSQVSALAALENKLFLKKTLSYIGKEKEYLYAELKRLGLFFIESATNFILVDFKNNTKALYEYLLKRGVIIREMGSWGFKNFFRVTVGTSRENKKFVKNLENFLNKGRKA